MQKPCYSNGSKAPSATYQLVAWWFLRGLGLIYCAAFASLALQISALAGAEGIDPITEQLATATERFGVMRWLSYPSLFWIAAGDWALLAVAWGGAVFSLLLVVGRNDRLLLVLVSAGLVTAAEMIAGRPFGVVSRWNEHIEPFRIANRYHVFPVIETERIVLGIEASQDGQTWVPLDFRYAPDATNQAPRFIVPRQPRVDWMLWFVPMNPLFLDWFDRFLQRLLDGSPAVTALVARPPVDDGPPQQLRVRVYRYRFTNPTQRDNSGDWWTREDLGPFYPLPFAERPHGR